MNFLTFCFIELSALAFACELFLAADFSSLSAESTSALRAARVVMNWGGRYVVVPGRVVRDDLWRRRRILSNSEGAARTRMSSRTRDREEESHGAN